MTTNFNNNGDNGEKQDEPVPAHAKEPRRRGRPATGRRPRIILTIPEELDEALTELADRFDIAKSTLLEKHAVLPTMADLIGFANWARDAAPERERDPDLWGRARWGLSESGPESLDLVLDRIQRGLTPGGGRVAPITVAQLDEDELRELKQLLLERRSSRA